MIIAFCGHRDFVANDFVKIKLLNILKKLIGNNQVSFYLGGYGKFDQFAYQCCCEYKMNNDAQLCLIKAYTNQKYNGGYDKVIFPNIEKVPKRIAIAARNRWIVDNCDVLIHFVVRNEGGAFKMLNYAQSKQVTCIDLPMELQK